MSHSFYSQIRRHSASTGVAAGDPVPMDRALKKRPSRPPLSLPPPCVQRLKGLSVVVVGGGFAGLMAARTLCRQGVNVTVFEARAQLGGRVLSDATFSRGRITEAGAELVGSIHTRWCELAIEYGLALISRMDGELYAGQGLNMQLRLDKKLSPDEIDELGKAMESVLRRIAQFAMQEISDPSHPWLEPKLLTYDRMSVADALVKYFGLNPAGDERAKRLWQAMQMLLEHDNVAKLEELNFLGLLCLVKAGQSGTIWDPLMGYWHELEIYRCADGCQRLALEMARDVQARKHDRVTGGKKQIERCMIHTHRAVTHIDLSKRKVSWKIVLPKGGLAPGPPTDQPFDYVILAIPPSVWRHVGITPLHPKDKVGLMRMGDAVKFFSNMKGRFWVKDKAAPYGGSLALGQVWEGTDNQTRVANQGVVLSVFAGARTPTEDHFKTELTRLYRNYPANLELKKPTMYANWPKQPYIEAGYASPEVGQIFKLGKQLIEPFQHDPKLAPLLFFAGEHTEMGYFGYMEGALRSGERAAELLMYHACGLKPPDAKPPVLVASAARGREAEQP